MGELQLWKAKKVREVPEEKAAKGLSPLTDAGLGSKNKTK